MTRGTGAQAHPDAPEKPAQLSARPPLAYDARTAAALISVPYETFLEMLRDGTIRAKRWGRQWIIPAAALNEWLNSP